MLKIKSDVYLSQKSGILQQKKVGALWRKENVQCFFNNFSNVTQCLQMSRFHVQSRGWEYVNVSVVATGLLIIQIVVLLLQQQKRESEIGFIFLFQMVFWAFQGRGVMLCTFLFKTSLRKRGLKCFMIFFEIFFLAFQGKKESVFQLF